MSKVITFSTRFPDYHFRKGEPTYFVEKFLKGLPDGTWETKSDLVSELPLALDTWTKLQPKYHTIRAGKRWKAGDYFSPRVWGNDVNPKSGRSGAYHSKQIILTSDIVLTDVFDFEIKLDEADEPSIFINGKFYSHIGAEDSEKIANNDGITLDEFKSWFKYPKPFSGQILCWNNCIKY